MRIFSKIGIGLLALALGIAVWFMHFPSNGASFYFRLPQVFAQAIFDQTCNAGLQPIGAAAWTTTNPRNGHLLQWGCVDTFGNLYIAGTSYIQIGASGASVQSAVTQAGANSLIILPAGKFNFNTTTVTVSALRTHIQGAGKWATEIDYCGPGSAFSFTAGAAVMYQSSIKGMLFNGACDGSNTNQKIAIKAIDVSEFVIDDIAVQNWKGNSGSGTTPSIGIWIQGRELSEVHNVSLTADRPIFLDNDPNIASESLDAFTFLNVYATPQVTTEPCIKVNPGAIWFHDRFIGIDCVAGQSIIDWNETGTPAQSNNVIFIANQHQNGPNNNAFYSMNFARNAGAGLLLDFEFDNIQTAVQQSGFFLQRTMNARISNLSDSNTTGNCINADNTNFDLMLLTNFCQSGSSVTNSSAHASTNFSQMIQPSISSPTVSGGISTSAPVSGSTGFQHKRNTGCATAAALNATCDTSFTWSSAFADANYSVSCSGDGVTSGLPGIQGTAISAGRSGTVTTVRTYAITAAAAQFTNIDCVAVHD